MQMKVFAIFDSKAEVYTKPFYALSVGEALRSFTDAVNEPASPYNKHPADYTLFAIGVYDDGNAQLDGCPHINLGCAIEMIEQPITTLQEVSRG